MSTQQLNPNQSSETSLVPTAPSEYLALSLPHSPQAVLHVQVTRLETSILSFLTTTDSLHGASLSALGSFVYAMPNVGSSLDSYSIYLLSSPYLRLSLCCHNHWPLAALSTFGAPLYRIIHRCRQHWLCDPSSQDRGTPDRKTNLYWMQCCLWKRHSRRWDHKHQGCRGWDYENSGWWEE